MTTMKTSELPEGTVIGLTFDKEDGPVELYMRDEEAWYELNAHCNGCAQEITALKMDLIAEDWGKPGCKWVKLEIKSLPLEWILDHIHNGHHWLERVLEEATWGGRDAHNPENNEDEDGDEV